MRKSKLRIEGTRGLKHDKLSQNRSIRMNVFNLHGSFPKNKNNLDDSCRSSQALKVLRDSYF